MKKIFLFFIVFFCLFSVSKRTIYADENFGVSSNVTYTVNQSGTTHVNFAETLKNTTDKYYATSYTVHVGFQNINNVVALDSDGAIVPSVKKAADGQDITVVFNKKAIGLGQSLPFQLSFDTPDVASLNGTIWEVNIPGLSNSADFDDFTVHVVVPTYFGNPTIIKPDVGDGSLTFTKDQLGTSGISLAFGDKQVYATHLTYHLQNTQVLPVRTEIALPPDTTYQHVQIDTISPKPTNVTMDTDGNWLAQYQLAPSQILTVTVNGKVYVSLTPKKQTLSSVERTQFSQQNTYWQTKDPKIQELAKQLRTPQAIYHYVVKTLSYNFARISDTQVRLGAVGVLQHPDQAVCLEFTDLFIAIARAAGIPARELDGYAYTQNTTQRPLSLQKEVLHAWPEYYDDTSGTWIMVDPTWENTTGGVDYFHTFDFDHLTFVIKGVSSTYPVPAGGYKLEGQENVKDIDVTFSPNSVEPDPTVLFGTNIPLEILAGLPLGGSLELSNSGSVIVPAQQVIVTSATKGKQFYNVAAIPPFGHTTLSLNFGRTRFLTNTTDKVTIQLAGKTVSKLITITAFSPLILGILGGIIIVIFSIIISIIARRPRSVPVSEPLRGDPLRGESKKS